MLQQAALSHHRDSELRQQQLLLGLAPPTVNQHVPREVVHVESSAFLLERLKEVDL